MILTLTRDQYYEFEKLSIGAFSPLNRFMTEADIENVCSNIALEGKEFFPVPVYLDIDENTKSLITKGDYLDLYYENKKVGDIRIEDIYKPNKEKIALSIFGTTCEKHPGVKYLKESLPYFIGGIVNPLLEELPLQEKTPQETRALFKKNGWKTIVGFQTRNVPHRAHEYLQRLSLEMVDAIFIHPLIGRKKIGDYHPDAIKIAYQVLIDNFYPKDRVYLDFLTTNMRYAGPREALFHALIRRNYGCTHFIVGRDHAGVGNYYELYQAQEMALKYEDQLGIKILPLKGPFYCEKCASIATERTCKHYISSPEMIQEVSGTRIRKSIVEKRVLDNHFIRPEIIDAIQGGKIFIT